MTLVLDKIQQLIPSRAKTSPSGWTSFNAPCCHHRGHSPDKRKRGGVMFSDGFVYNCFNCKFTANWQPGRQISRKLRSLLTWMGASEQEINQIIFEALKTESSDYVAQEVEQRITFEARELPEDSMSLLNAAHKHPNEVFAVLEYIVARGFDFDDYDFQWSPSQPDRVIVPFRYGGKTVGHTARRVTDGKPKYIGDQPPYFVFNLDAQREDQKFVLVTEGPFDAISVNGVALLTNEISEQQARLINELGSTPILIPDQDRAGLVAVDQAAKLGWGVAFPNWEPGIKDVNDAVIQYGKLYVTVDAIQTAQFGEIKIQVARNQMEKAITAQEYREQL